MIPEILMGLLLIEGAILLVLFAHYGNLFVNGLNKINEGIKWR